MVKLWLNNNDIYEFELYELEKLDNLKEITRSNGNI
jgi:hypothetical protein